MLVLLEDEKMLADSASELLSSVSPVSQQRALRDESNELGFYPEVWQQFVEMGWTAIPFAEELGGLAFSYKGLTAVFEQVGRHLTASPSLFRLLRSGRFWNFFMVQPLLLKTLLFNCLVIFMRLKSPEMGKS